MKIKGFTLIELLIVLAISSLIGGVSYRIYIKQQRQFYVYGTQQHLQLKVKNALDAVVEDLKSCRGQITYNPDDNSYTWLRFIANGDSNFSYDNVVPVRFFLASNEVYREFNGKRFRVSTDIEDFRLEPINDKKTENAAVRITVIAKKELNGIKENGLTKEVSAQVSTVVFLKQEYFKNAQKFWKIGNFDYKNFINIDGNFTLQQDINDTVNTIAENIQNEPGKILTMLENKLKDIEKNINNLVDKITDLEANKAKLLKKLKDLKWWQKSAKKKIKQSIKDIEEAIEKAKREKENLENAKEEVEAQIAQIEGETSGNTANNTSNNTSAQSGDNGNNDEPGFIESAQNAANTVGDQINNYQNADFDSL